MANNVSTNELDTNSEELFNEKPKTPEEQKITGPDQSNKDWENDRRRTADAQHEGLDRFLKASVGERANFLRDLLIVSVTVLIGGATLYFTTTSSNHQIIKSPLLFLSAVVLITGAIVINLFARLAIIQHLQAISYQIENNYIELYRASRNYLLNQSRTNLDTAYRIEYANLELPKLKIIANAGHVVVVWLLITGIVLVGLSLLIHLTF